MNWVKEERIWCFQFHQGLSCIRIVPSLRGSSSFNSIKDYLGVFVLTMGERRENFQFHQGLSTVEFQTSGSFNNTLSIPSRIIQLFQLHLYLFQWGRLFQFHQGLSLTELRLNQSKFEINFQFHQGLSTWEIPVQEQFSGLSFNSIKDYLTPAKIAIIAYSIKLFQFHQGLSGLSSISSSSEISHFQFHQGLSIVYTIQRVTS